MSKTQFKKGDNSGKLNNEWKGDDVGYHALHAWIRRHLPKPEFCQMCNTKPATDLANITGIYNRDFSNWKYFCHQCHLIYDNIIERNLRPHQFKKGDTNHKYQQPKDMSNWFCLLCNKNTTSLKPNGRPHWYNFQDGHICKVCYNKKLKKNLNLDF